jgi:hypothetical protein
MDREGFQLPASLGWWSRSGWTSSHGESRGTYDRPLGREAVSERQLLEAGLLDVPRLMVCPLVVPKTGIEAIGSIRP